MRDRLLFGPILIAAVIALTWLDGHLDRSLAPAWWPNWLTESGTLPPGLVVFPLLTLLSVLAAAELAFLLSKKNVIVSPRTLTCAAALGLACWLVPHLPFAWASAPALMPTLAVAALLVGMLSVLRLRQTSGVLAAAGAALFAFVYLGLLPGFLLITRVEFGEWTLLWVVLVVKSCDIGALFTGKLIGRHKLIPWLSPGKTWEGLVGGAVFAAFVAVLGSIALARLHEPLAWTFGVTALAGASAAILGQLGDLAASSLKRDAAVKDSGSVIPGMGGILDVIDSPLLVAPIAYWALLLSGR